ncbi:neprilysin-1-like [Paramacrobiotus metropolitanus]|uniref:neprilysin-1-like n=1 Tax=Paramacrobiotus metropolitanus TaxID=2943436 RepID=UPI002445FCFA|nr:neprilysin-1-like [Paramacrobiotus metropolitanus]
MECLQVILLIGLAAYAAAAATDLNLSLISPDQSGNAVQETVDPMDTIMSPDANNSICATTACANTAKEMLSYMNLTVDPCQDFYEYACGRYGEHHEIKPDQSSATQFYYQDEKLLKELRSILESNETEASHAREAARQLYKICLDKDALRKNGVQPVMDILQKTIGGWPILTPNWDPDAFDLWKALIYFDEYGFDPLLSVSIVADLHNASFNRLSIGIPGGFNKNLWSSTAGKKYIATYPSFMLNVTRIFANLSSEHGDFESRYNWTDIEIQLNKTQDFYLFLTNLSSTSLELKEFEKFYNLHTLANVTSSLFFRSNFSKGVFGFIRDSLTFGSMGHLASEDMVVNIPKPAAMEAYDKKMAEIEKLGVEGKRFLANHLGWKIVAGYSADLAQPLFDTFELQGRILSGKNKTDPIWKRCVWTAEAYLPLAVASLYVDKVLDKHVKQKVSDMVINIRTSFTERLNSADWMDAETRARALEKLHGMLEFNVYPAFYALNISLIEEMYENVTVGEGMFNTSLELNRESNIRRTQRLDKVNTREYVLDRLYTVTTNAQYMPTYNIIAIFAGVSQPPFFDVDIPDYFNYGSLGHVIGHEITHGFDDQGSKFDETGKMFNWWSNSSRKAFDSKASLIVEQYSQYKTPFGNINGNLTLSENIADAGGLKTTFNAYQLHLHHNGSDLHLPGLQNHTNNMMFFLSAAQVWCGLQRPEREQLNLVSDPHTPRRWRVNGEMATFREFAKAYNCPADSAMIYNQSNGLWR